MPASLSVNLNAVAYLRNRRGLPWPSVEAIGRLALQAGAAGLTVHPRPDERHITRGDVGVLKRLLDQEFPDREFNIEGYPDERFLALIAEVRPAQVTLVPDEAAQATSDHGWDFGVQGDLLAPIIQRLKSQGARVSLFIDPDPKAPAAARALGADRGEIYTGPYGGALDPAQARAELDRIAATGRAAAAAGLGLNAGHDLTRANLPALAKTLPNLLEVSIGHALIGDAIAFGIAETVRLYRLALDRKEA